jgi:hypothetical protein
MMGEGFALSWLAGLSAAAQQKAGGGSAYDIDCVNLEIIISGSSFFRKILLLLYRHAQRGSTNPSGGRHYRWGARVALSAQHGKLIGGGRPARRPQGCDMLSPPRVAA